MDEKLEKLENQNFDWTIQIASSIFEVVGSQGSRDVRAGSDDVPKITGQKFGIKSYRRARGHVL